jgi:hypothetical protein
MNLGFDYNQYIGRDVPLAGFDYDQYIDKDVPLARLYGGDVGQESFKTVSLYQLREA